eukprot:gnl/MRDRNA2_/MRDRNA2_98726_c0_seq1.p1 gnl/MRDRNA2_/MRDRNA2_98726_c0~~gnl/MRDRNA2_/MRDRNA2_98726_c0_seq1.p1  ORF type:complete len:495 (-),score=113.47 gnl/MRDRNA2_/MRDRNA2_98726_c0_seq1:188-1672(-)
MEQTGYMDAVGTPEIFGVGTPEPLDNGPRLGVEIQVLSLVQQVLMRQQLMEEVSRSQEVALLTKLDDLQSDVMSKVLSGTEQTQCLIGGLHMQLMNMQAQVQALLIGQAQLQAQIARQAVVLTPTPSGPSPKEALVLSEVKPQPETNINQSDADAPDNTPTKGKRKRPGSRTRRRAKYLSNRSLPEPLQQIEDVECEEERSSAGSGEIANLAEFDNMFDNFACCPSLGVSENVKGDGETDKELALPCLVQKQFSSEFEADASSCGGGSPHPSLRGNSFYIEEVDESSYGGGSPHRLSSFCLEEVDNPQDQECLSPLMEEELLAALNRLRNGEKKAAKQCMSIINNKEFTGINAKSQGGRSMLHIAVRCKHQDICLAILAHPDFTEVNAKYRGYTALTLAAEKRLSRVCLAILQHPDFSEINAKTTGRGETALHLAASNGLLEVCHAIMKRVDFHAVNASTLPRSMGCTAAEVAEGCGHGEVAAVIRNHAAAGGR